MATVVIPFAFSVCAIECKPLVKHPNYRTSSCSELIGYATIMVLTVFTAWGNA